MSTTTKRLPQSERALLARYRRFGCLDSIMALGELALRAGRADDAAELFWVAQMGGHPDAKSRGEPVRKRVNQEKTRLQEMYRECLQDAYQDIAAEFAHTEDV